MQRDASAAIVGAVADQSSPAVPINVPEAATCNLASHAEPVFAELINAMKLDVIRRNVEKVRPQTLFSQYNAKKKTEYNSNMNSFDLAFGLKDGITGNEKLTELSGHWFAGSARNAIIATAPTEDDPRGDVAYAVVRQHLDRIYGQDVDSAADALSRLKEGGVIAKDNVGAHHNLYLDMLAAHNHAISVNNAELFDRKSTLQEVLAARMPFYAEKFFEDYERSDGFDKLLKFLVKRIDIIKLVQVHTQKTQTVKINATEAKEAKQQQYGPNTFSQQLQNSPKKDQPEECQYCQSFHKTHLCNRLLILSLEERVSAVSKLRLCFHCLTSGHNAKDCPEKKEVTCTTCNKKGHIAMFHGRPALNPSNGPSESSRRNGNANNVNFDTNIVAPPAKDAKDSSSGDKSDENPTI